MDGQRRIKIGLFLGISSNAGGMFQYAQSILEGLSSLNANNYKVVIAYGSPEWEAVLGRYNLRGIMLRHLSIGLRLANVVMALCVPGHVCRWAGPYINPLIREMRALSCDCWIFPAQDALSYQLSTMSIGTIHDLMHRYQPHFPEVSSRLRFGIREHRFRAITSYCAVVLVDSEMGKQHVLESYEAKAASIYPLPYVAPSYMYDPSNADDLVQHYGLPEKFLFYPAQFWQHKNHHRLLEAVAIVAKQHPDIALVCSGGKRHEFKRVEQRAVELGLANHVRFVGYVPDANMRGFYLRSRALVMPTFFGPTNIPPLEAMAVGCPILISRLYGMPEQSGDAALYFDPLDVNEMADCIAQIWSNDTLAAELSYKGLARSAVWTQAAFNARMEQIIEQVALIQKS